MRHEHALQCSSRFISAGRARLHAGGTSHTDHIHIARTAFDPSHPHRDNSRCSKADAEASELGNFGGDGSLPMGFEGPGKG